jgi:hypothetical protein
MCATKITHSQYILNTHAKLVRQITFLDRNISLTSPNHAHFHRSSRSQIIDLDLTHAADVTTGQRNPLGQQSNTVAEHKQSVIVVIRGHLVGAASGSLHAQIIYNTIWNSLICHLSAIYGITTSMTRQCGTCAKEPIVCTNSNDESSGRSVDAVPNY